MDTNFNPYGRKEEPKPDADKGKPGGPLPPPPSPSKPHSGDAPRKSRVKLTLMTKHEELDRAVVSARHHYITKLTRYDRRKKKRGELLQFLWDRTVAVGGIGLIAYGFYWCYSNYDELNSYWNNFLERLRSL